MPEENRVLTASMQYISMIEDWAAIEKVREGTRAESKVPAQQSGPPRRKNGMRKKSTSHGYKSKR